MIVPFLFHISNVEGTSPRQIFVELFIDPQILNMPLENLDKDGGLQTLNAFVSERSYIEGHLPSQADVAVFEAVKAEPCSNKFPHASRWFRHIQSYASEFAALPGTKKALGAYGPAASIAKAEDDEDDLFGEDDDNEEVDEAAEEQKAQRLAEYKAKKAAKGPGPVAKSSVLLDVKPWDDTTDMGEVERLVRSIEMDGLLWGASKLVPIGYGIRKLQMSLVIEDDKISMDELQEKIQANEDYVQSTDIASFNKI
jgi:elongation factor 1-beta